MEYAQPKYNGEPTIKAIANGLGTLGRYGDNYMVHAAEGETVVPAEVLDANPELKQHLFWQMRMMGIKDPNRYVVGNNLNSINLVTGQPEFFFKKIFKAVKKVFKKVLPIAAPIIGNLIAPGIGGIIATGLVTKLQGGSWGDVLKSAALSYGVGALGQGIGGAISGGGFAEGLGKGIMSPFQAAGNLFSSGAQNPLAQGILGPGGMKAIFPSAGAALRATPTAGAPIPGSLGGGTVGAKTLGYSGGLFPTYNPGFAGAAHTPSSVRATTTQAGRGPYTQQVRDLGPGTRVNAPVTPGGADVNVRPDVQYGGSRIADPIRFQTQGLDGSNLPLDTSVPTPSTTVGEQVVAGSQGADPKLAEGFRGIDTQTAGYGTGADAPNTIKGLITGDYPGGRTGAALRMGEKALETLGPSVVAAGIPAAIAYFTTDDPDDLPDDHKPLPGTAQASAYDQYVARGRLKDAEGVRLLREAGIAPVQDAQAIATSTGLSLADAQAFIDNYYGGEAVSVARGGEITGPGTGTSDSIPARLSDGEFVMTADAVRGAGNGNRNLGAARMYDMMSRYERGVV